MSRDIVTSPGLQIQALEHSSSEEKTASPGRRQVSSSVMDSRRLASLFNIPHGRCMSCIRCYGVYYYSDCCYVYYRMACAIEDSNTQTLIITGGFDTMTTVSVYSLQGWVEDLQSLNTGRYFHACAYYLKANRMVREICRINKYMSFLFYSSHFLIQVFLVTGGYDESDRLDSTELYDPSMGSWVSGAKLPRPLNSLSAASIDARIIILGTDI